MHNKPCYIEVDCIYISASQLSLSTKRQGVYPIVFSTLWRYIYNLKSILIITMQNIIKYILYIEATKKKPI